MTRFWLTPEHNPLHEKIQSYCLLVRLAKVVLREPGGDGRLARRTVSQEDDLQLTILLFPAFLLRIRHDRVGKKWHASLGLMLQNRNQSVFE